MIRLNVFAGAYDKVPRAQDDLEWSELCDELEAMSAIEAPAKSGLLAFTLGVLVDNERGKGGTGSPEAPCNLNANYLNHTALAIDVDECDTDAVCTELGSQGTAAFLYASASDPNPDGSRRCRIVAPVSRPIPPEHVKHCRLAFAESIGVGPGQGVENAMAVSQLMYVGRLEGSPTREVWRLGGDALDVDVLIATPLRATWKVARERAETTPAERVAQVDPNARTAALLEALAEHWDAPGAVIGRRQILRALGSYLAKRGWDDEQIAAVGRGLETERPERVRVHLMVDAAQQARVMPNATAGWTTLTNWSVAAATVIEAHAKHPHEPEGFEGVFNNFWQAVYTRRANRTAPPPPHAAPEPMPDDATTEPADVYAPPDAEADEDNSIPLVLQARKGNTILLWEGDERGHQPISKDALRLRIAELGFDQSLVPLKENGKDIPPHKIVEAFGATYKTTAYAFAQRVSEYDPARQGRVRIGYPDAGVPAKYDDDADAWLLALAGDHYERLAVWIAACAQPNIDRLAACLIVIGEADTGKSMFGHAVARLWGEAPTSMGLLTAETFNGDMLRSPILVDEEAQVFGSKKLTTKKFRDVVQQSMRLIEEKFMDPIQLIGAQRFVVSCNGMSDLRFSDLGGPAVIKALRDRMLVIDATPRSAECAATLARLRLPNSYLVNIERIAGHFAWLAEALEMPVERFVGAGGDNADGAILSGHADDTADLWETFRDWLDAPGAGPTDLWSIHDGQLCADSRALASTLEAVGRGWDLVRVRAALAPVHVGNVRPRIEGRPRLWIVDAKRVGDSLELDTEAREVLESRMASASRHTNDPRGARFGKFSR